MKGRPLYLAGESYAGVYIPTLAAEIGKRFHDTSVVNLHGMWVTDPCTDNKAQFGALDLNPDFAFRKDLISKDTYETLTNPSHSCFTGRTPVGDYIKNTTSEACKKAWRLYDIATSGVGDAVHPKEVGGMGPLDIDPLDAYGPATEVCYETYLTREDVRAAFHASSSPNKVYHLNLAITATTID